MFARRIRRAFEKNRNEIAGIALSRYPPFVRRDVAPANVPAFQFHGVSAATLDPLLGYLSANGYRTLTADEYLRRAIGAAQATDREVLLTFDDGRASLYAVVFPLLRRYGQTAVAYVVPGRVPERATAADTALCDWAQLREMHDSGVVDIQSHSMHHHSIAVSPKVVDYVRPGIATSFLDADLAPLAAGPSDRAPRQALPWGLPLREWGARMGDSPAFCEDPAVDVACIRHVDEHGGASFFRSRGWRRELDRVLEDARKTASPGRLESDAEQARHILSDLREARETLEARLPGKPIRHFCFPWYVGSRLAVECSRDAGYLTNAWASLLPSFVGASDTAPVPIARLAPRYIWRLPGRGRKSLMEVLCR
ncbi:MAG: polysaccharide deacetylase family protein [Burkholderiaceae bacterium]|nr:polysaccharide deacetylase family protein [Burkholderiaceae bacterium]